MKFLQSFGIAATMMCMSAAANAQELPDALYLVGSMNGWQFTPEYALVEGSEEGVYKGVYDIPADMLEFKIFNTDDMSWDNPDTYFGCVEGKFNVYSDKPGVVTMSSSASSNFSCANWVGGYAEITVDYYKNTVTIEGSEQPVFTEEPPAEESEMYLIGHPQGWNIGGSEMPLDKVDGYEGLYYGNYEINAGEAMFRFYTQLGDWENNSIGAQFEDAPVDFEISSDGVLTSPAVYGKGSWNFPLWNGGVMYILVDVNKMEVSFSNSDFLTSVGVNGVETDSLSINMAGDKLMFGCDSEYKIYTIDGTLVLSGKGDFASLENLKGGMYVVKATTEGASASVKICR